MKGIYQHDDNDCGLACILTVCKQLKIKVNEWDLRKNLYLGKEGLSLFGVTEALRERGINSYALECDADELYQLYHTDKMPVILMICEDNEFHYTVLYKLDSKNLYIWNPNKGKRFIKPDAFFPIWTGYAVKITDTACPKQGLTSKPFFCFKILKKQYKFLFTALLFAILLMAASILVTFSYKEVIDGIKYDGHGLENIFIFLLVMGFGYIIMMIISIIKERLILYANREMELSLNYHFINALLHMSIQKREDYSSGGILDRYYKLPSVVKTFSSVFSSVILEILSLLAGICIMITINPIMFAMVNIIVTSYIICFFIARSKLFILSKSIMDKQSILTTCIKETVQNLITLKSFDSATYEEKTKAKMQALKQDETRLEYLSIIIGIVLQAIENGTMLLILTYGIYSITQGEMSFGTLLAFETFVEFFLSPVKNLLSALPSVQETVLTFQKIEDVLLFSESNEKKDMCPKIKGDILLDNVEIAYGFDNPILKNVSFKINHQDKVFLMGASGSGKSTLAKTLAGFVNYTNGTILYDGQSDIDLSKNILYLSQDAEIFSGTIRENILMWKDCFDVDLFDEVLYNIGVYHFMELRGFTLDSHLQENGTNLSGGEKQRIAIARALLYDMPIYIFDEATVIFLLLRYI